MSTNREVENWITVNHKHVPVFKNESSQDAFNRSVALQNEKKRESDIAKAKEQADVLNGKSKDKFEKAKGLIFGTTRLTDKFTDIDGYVNKKTEKAMLEQLAKAVEKYDDGEAGYLRDMIKFNEIAQSPSTKDGGEYILEWEEVPNAGRFNDNDEYETKDAKFYVHIRIPKR